MIMTKKRQEIHRSSHLPEKGWFQACIICSSITSHIILYTSEQTDRFDFEIYTCRPCTKTLANIKKYLSFAKISETYIGKFLFNDQSIQNPQTPESSVQDDLSPQYYQWDSD